MLQVILDLAVTFWMWTILIAIILVGWIIDRLDMRQKTNLTFTMKEMPQLRPIVIETKGKGFWKSMLHWFLSTRNWEVTKDWHYTIDDIEYVIPKGFQFDGASIPKFLRTFFSPVGVLLIGGLVHDYMYKYAACKPADKKGQLLLVDQKKADQIFRDINIEVNGFYFMNYLAYWSLRLGGFVAWNGHRKRNAKIK